MRWQILGQAVAVFVTTNLDDLLIILVFVAEARATGASRWRVVAGQYLGFMLILVLSLLGAAGAGLLPATWRRLLGLLPLFLGLRAAWRLVRSRRAAPDERDAPHLPGIFSIGLLTLASGGDNIGAYVPIFASSGAGTTAEYLTVFLILLAFWCLIGQALTAFHTARDYLSRWGDVILPIVLTAIGVTLLARRTG